MSLQNGFFSGSIPGYPTNTLVQFYVQAVAANGRSVTALNELAFLAYARGDREGAVALLRRALAIRPDDADIRANYDRIVRERGSGVKH